MKRPNILLITCDELQKEVLSCYGNRAIKTPNTDALAENGIRFEKAYTVSPWCLPARCSILTGLYPHHSGAYSNFRKCALDGGVSNMFKAFKGGGYKTSLFGKCHFAPVPYGETKPDVTLPYDEFKEYYMSLGLDRLDLQDDKQVSVWFTDDYSKELEKAGYLKAYRDATWSRDNAKVFPFPAPAEWHPDMWVGRKAAEYIKTQSRDGGEFIWVSFSGPHYPFDAPKEYYDRVDKSKLREMSVKENELADETRIHHKAYYGGGGIDGSGPAENHGCKNYTPEYWERLRLSYNANVALIDDAVGLITAAAKEKYGGDVMIIFTADHGEMLGDHGLWGKNNCGYEQVLNIPFIINYPKQYKPETTGAVINSVDIMPTCLKAAGINDYKCDGKPIDELLEGGGRQITFAEGEGFLCTVKGTDKYLHIRQTDGEYEELHDLKADPQEFYDYSRDAEHTEVLSKMRSLTIDHFISTVLP